MIIGRNDQFRDRRDQGHLISVEKLRRSRFRGSGLGGGAVLAVLMFRIVRRRFGTENRQTGANASNDAFQGGAARYVIVVFGHIHSLLFRGGLGFLLLLSIFAFFFIFFFIFVFLFAFFVF